MNIRFPDTATRQPRLILLFAGWGMSPRPLEDVAMPGYDVAVVWDYRDMSAPWAAELEAYDEVSVVAWSFGVHAASRFIDNHPGLHITARIAVNGTRFTADDTRGIPRAIFDGTLASLDERSVTKFNMRMCGGAAAYKDFAARAPQRLVGELREELMAFDTAEAPRLVWDKAFVAMGDMIIPPACQLNAWRDDAVQTIRIEGPHLPDFNALLRCCFTDKSHVERRFRKAEPTYDANAPVQHSTSATLLDLVAAHAGRTLGNILEIGCGTGRLSAMISEHLHPSRLELWDLHIAPQIDALRLIHTSSAVDITTRSCDAETAIRTVADGSLDLIISASTVQWFNSLRSFLRQAARKLAPGGMIALSTYGPDTMREVHAALGTASRYAGPDDLRRALPSDLEVVELNEEHRTVLFDTPMEVLRHMSRTGVNALSADMAGPAAAAKLLRDYPLDGEGRAPLTYHPIYIILRKL